MAMLGSRPEFGILIAAGCSRAARKLLKVARCWHLLHFHLCYDFMMMPHAFLTKSSAACFLGTLMSVS